VKLGGTVLALASVMTSACASLVVPGSSAGRAAEQHFTRAIANLDSANNSVFLDSAAAHLEAYLASGAAAEHRREATVLLRLTHDAQRLNRVEAALQQAKTTAADEKPKAADAKKPDDEAVKEIQRLKDELAKANEELERIKKRLAAPKP